MEWQFASGATLLSNGEDHCPSTNFSIAAAIPQPPCCGFDWAPHADFILEEDEEEDRADATRIGERLLWMVTVA